MEFDTPFSFVDHFDASITVGALEVILPDSVDASLGVRAWNSHSSKDFLFMKQTT